MNEILFSKIGEYGQTRIGYIPHSLASVVKTKQLISYNPLFSLKDGLNRSVKWYWENLRE